MNDEDMDDEEVINHDLAITLERKNDDDPFTQEKLNEMSDRINQIVREYGFSIGIVAKYPSFSQSMLELRDDLRKYLPKSIDEKTRVEQHWLFVHELISLLDKLELDDWLTPNRVNNLLIGRGDKDEIGIIDFHWGEVEMFYEDEE